MRLTGGSRDTSKTVAPAEAGAQVSLIVRFSKIRPSHCIGLAFNGRSAVLSEFPASPPARATARSILRPSKGRGDRLKEPLIKSFDRTNGNLLNPFVVNLSNHTNQPLDLRFLKAVP